eukprot:m.81908 g.81908  ORF g.81908 m.81908 type:complete len:128 (+) comp25467_c0_seq1:273-656(+)
MDTELDEKDFKQLAQELDADTLRNLLLQINYAVPDAASVSLEFLASQGQLSEDRLIMRRSFSLDNLVDAVDDSVDVRRMSSLESGFKFMDLDPKAATKKKKMMKAREKEEKKQQKAAQKLAKKQGSK